MLLENVIVLEGESLVPRKCAAFEWSEETGRITRMDFADETDYTQLFAAAGCRHVIIPGLVNAHTHIGDGAFPDGSLGLTLEQGFFRPNGYKYCNLECRSDAELVDAMAVNLRYMARSGTVAHWDFREQGLRGVRLLRTAEAQAKGAVRSVVLGQLAQIPWTEQELDGQFTEGASRLDLPERCRAELEGIWRDDALFQADGFSESTMNDLSDVAFSEINKLSVRHGNKLRAIHCLENEGYRSVSLLRTNNGATDLERAIRVLDADIIVHLTAATAVDIEFLRKTVADDAVGTRPRPRAFVLCPRANASLGLNLPPIRSLMEAGLLLLLGTDNIMLNPPNMFAEMDFAFKLAKSQWGDSVHPEPRDILRMASTIHAYPTMFGAGCKGGLFVGGRADFVVLDCSREHLRLTKNILAAVVSRVTPEDVVATVRAGQTVAGAL